MSTSLHEINWLLRYGKPLSRDPRPCCKLSSIINVLDKQKKVHQSDLNTSNLTYNHLKRQRNKIIFEIQRNQNIKEKLVQQKDLLNGQVENLTKKIGNSKVNNNHIKRKLKDLKIQHGQIVKRIKSALPYVWFWLGYLTFWRN